LHHAARRIEPVTNVPCTDEADLLDVARHRHSLDTASASVSVSPTMSHTVPHSCPTSRDRLIYFNWLRVRRVSHKLSCRVRHLLRSAARKRDGIALAQIRRDANGLKQEQPAVLSGLWGA
jgi:hypothetical protein